MTVYHEITSRGSTGKLPNRIHEWVGKEVKSSRLHQRVKEDFGLISDINTKENENALN